MTYVLPYFGLKVKNGRCVGSIKQIHKDCVMNCDMKEQLLYLMISLFLLAIASDKAHWPLLLVTKTSEP